jgi:hypothetical protein
LHWIKAKEMAIEILLSQDENNLSKQKVDGK